jgi:UDP-2,4-diacetamido-2,4,6-trideoxy-beta-L-altropyranose hydrolase
MNIVFRVDSSATIGSGHVMRCLILATALRESKENVFFICREHEGNLCDLIKQQGIGVWLLPAAGTQDDDFSGYSAWLGAPWQKDAKQTINAIEVSSVKPDLLVVDHYSIDYRWENALRSLVGRIMVIDDLANRKHDCDLLLDQNLVAEMHTRYAGLVSDACRLMLGPKYSLLQPIYAELQEGLTIRKGPIRRIFIFFGESGRKNLTGLAIAAFERLNRPDIQVDVVIGSNYRYAKAFRKKVEGHKNIHLHSGLSTLAPLMAKADLAIGASGTTSWERLCLGLPTVVVSIADNQHDIAVELNRRGLIQWLGPQDSVDEQALTEVLGSLIEKGLDEKWSQRCRNTVDGKGSERVFSVMSETAKRILKV